MSVSRSFARKCALATATAGSLDLLFAATITTTRGNNIGDMLRFVASGPFPQAKQWGAEGAALGVAVHFTLMALMAAAYMFAAAKIEAVERAPIAFGLIYGFLTYVFLNLIIVPLRFGTWPPTVLTIVTQLFAHLVLVGLVFAGIGKKHGSR